MRDEGEATLLAPGDGPPPSAPAVISGVAETAVAAAGPGGVSDAPGTDETDPLCGRTLHHFRILSRIGQGGMGSVYRAHDVSLDRAVALKVIATDRGQDPAMRERFFREARAQARLTHPNVVPIYYIGEEEGLIFFAMELVDGGTLEQTLGEGAPDLELTIERMIAVARALKLAHERGFIHRDIKPSNLLVDGAGQVKVADFGLVKPVEAAAVASRLAEPGSIEAHLATQPVQLTQAGAVMGSPLYISPEAGRGDPTDFRSDIYSFGATFYHLLTGRPPFSAATPIGVITKHLTQPLPPVREVKPAVSPALAAILERAMEKDPARRYQSYDELLAALVAARPEPTTTAGVWVRTMALAVDVLMWSVLAGIFGHKVATPLLAVYLIGGWHRFGKTVGKWLFRLQVRDLDNQLPSLKRCVIRFLVLGGGAVGLLVAELLSSWGKVWVANPGKWWNGTVALLMLVYLVMFIWTGVRKDRRGLHDRAAGTMVVYHLIPRPPTR